jgi:hypothetical protein
MGGQSAMAMAIEAFRNPSRLLRKAVTPFPDGMLLVIKAAAGDTATIEACVTHYGHSASSIQEMAKSYLIKQLLDPKASGLRLLGLNPGAETSQIKDHKRWLLKWLHPDRNPSAWEQAYFNRISTLTEANLVSPSTALVAPPIVKKHGTRRRPTALHPARKPRTSPGTLLFKSLRPFALIAAVALATSWLLTSQPNIFVEAKSFLDQFAGASNDTSSAYTAGQMQ